MIFNHKQLSAFFERDFYHCFGLAANQTRSYIKPPLYQPSLPVLSCTITHDTLEAHIDHHADGDLISTAYALLAFYKIAHNPQAAHDGWQFIPVAPLHNSHSGSATLHFKNITETQNVIQGDLWLSECIGTLALRYEHAWPYESTATDVKTSFRHAALGQPSLGYGQHMSKYDAGLYMPRLPNNIFLCMSDIVQQDLPHKHCVTSFDVSAEAWYFTHEQTLPIAIFLEALLQPCGWLMHKLGMLNQFSETVYFRNLNGSLQTFAALPKENYKLTHAVTLTSAHKLGNAMILNFDVITHRDDQLISKLSTSFGFFTHKSLATQKGLQTDETFTPPSYRPIPHHKPQHPLSLIEDVLYCDTQEIFGRRFISPDDWYFKAHFFQDPVQPGSLGIQMLCDLCDVLMQHKYPTIAVTSCETCEWQYRGQVLLTQTVVEAKIKIMAEEKQGNKISIEAKGWLWCDKLCIYHLKSLVRHYVIR